jgi:hypothetical protein
VQAQQAQAVEIQRLWSNRQSGIQISPAENALLNRAIEQQQREQLQRQAQANMIAAQQQQPPPE